MWLYILIAIVILSTIIVLVLHNQNATAAKPSESSNSNLSIFPGSSVETIHSAPDELAIKFENLPALMPNEETRLIEINDSKLLARINNTIPGTTQAIANSAAAKGAQKIAEESGKLYKVIIPSGAKLDKSRAMDGAYRAIFRDKSNNISGHANLVPVDTSSAKNLAAVNVANAAMGTASMVVGQYYMTQINNHLEKISDGLDEISDFQNKEFEGKVYALVAEVQSCATFQTEIIENDELRKRELLRLQNLEHECAELLGQANLTIQEYAKHKVSDYSEYEKAVEKAQKWFQYQGVLLKIMGQISDLTYTLNLGGMSRENSQALFLPYANQTANSQNMLLTWHENACNHLKIDVDASRRERQGLDKAFMLIPSLFNEDLQYKVLSENTVSKIRSQTNNAEQSKTESNDLFQEDVQLIAKDGKLYYLPQEHE